jgi:hypothetical protein
MPRPLILETTFESFQSFPIFSHAARYLPVTADGEALAISMPVEETRLLTLPGPNAVWAIRAGCQVFLRLKSGPIMGAASAARPRRGITLIVIYLIDATLRRISWR